MSPQIRLTEAFRAQHPAGTRVRHPMHGAATIVGVTESHIEVNWDSPLARIEQDRFIPAAEVPYMSRIIGTVQESVKPSGLVNNKTLNFNGALRGKREHGE